MKGTLTTNEVIGSTLYTTIKPPVYKWEFRYFKNDTMVYMKERAPNWFNRLMQALILGVQWKRITK